MNQRWRNRLATFRHPDEIIEPRRYDVAPIDSDATAKRFVETHHYSRSYPAARFRFGLYEAGELVGVAVFSIPCSAAVLTKYFGGAATESVELGRFVLLDRVPGNGETWFLGRCFRLLRDEGLRGVLSFSDPTPRRTAAGAVLFPGHVGTIYRAHNGVQLGRSTARTLRLLPDGRVFSDRAISKIRSGDRGWRYAAGQLCEFGAPPPPQNSPHERHRWLTRALAEITRTLRHPGNLRFAWGFSRGMRRDLHRREDRHR